MWRNASERVCLRRLPLRGIDGGGFRGSRTWYTLLFDAISGHGGIVSLMIGDGLMAIFDAPVPLADPPGSAVRAARDMIELIELFDAERAAAATYTGIGDTVNLASRLEAHTKVAGRAILVDSETRAALGSPPSFDCSRRSTA